MSLLLSRFYPQASAVLTSGNQNISGIKNFDSRPTVRGTGVLLSGEAAGNLTSLSNIIFTTGDQGLYSDYYPYLASWFTTNSPLVPNGLHISTSKDGLNWNVITSRPNSFENELRDPSIIKLDNKWAIAFTENAFVSNPFNSASNNSGFFGLLESTNLATWSYRRVSLSGLLNNIGIPPRNYNRLWAPEWFKEDNGTLYLTFSINQTGWGNHNRGHMMYIVQATDYNLTGWTNLRRLSGSAFPFLPSVGVTQSYYDLFIEKTGDTYYSTYWDEENIETRLAVSNNLFTGWRVLASGKTWYGTNFPYPGSFTDGSYKEGACIRYLDGKWRLWITDVLGVNSGIYSEGPHPTGMSFVGLMRSPNYRLEHGTVIKNDNVANMIYYSGLVNQFANQNISGVKNFDSRPTVRGVGVLLQGEAAGNQSDILFTSGTQTITGPKNFTARPTFNGNNLITTGDLVNLELNIEGALASSSAFNGNRQIKRIPSLLDPAYGGTTISGFLENMFFPYINRSLTQTAFTVFPYGYTGVSGIDFNGSIVSGDDIQTGIAYVEGVTIRSGPVSISNSALTYSANAVPLATVINATTAENYRTRLYVTRNNVPNTIIQSTNVLRMRFEPPYFYGVSDNPSLGVGITTLTRVNPSTYLNINGSNYGINGRPSFITQNGTQGLAFTLFSPGYIYFAYPNFTNGTDSITSWGLLANTAGVVDTTNLFDYTSQFVANTSTITFNFPTRSNLTYRIYRSDLITPITTTTLNLRFTFQ